MTCWRGLVGTFVGVGFVTATAIGDAEEGSELARGQAMVEKARITMTKVVDIAVKEVKDGTPFRAGLELEDDLPQYEVSLMVGRQCVEEEIDAVSGKVLSVEKQKLETTAGYR